MSRRAGRILACGLTVAVGTAMPPAWAHGTTKRVSVSSGGAQGDDGSVRAAISADGRFVAFQSSASNLVPSDTNGTSDVFVRDRQTGTTRRVNLGPGGIQGDAGSAEPAISADGRFVASSRLPPTWCRTAPTESLLPSSATARQAPPSS
jgi:hypothetical protein